MTMDHFNNNWRDGLARIQLTYVFTSKYKQDLSNDLRITIGDTVVDCSSQVKNLGVIFDRV